MHEHKFLQLKSFVEKNVALCQPENVHICDGSEAENQKLISVMVKLGTLEPLPKYKNWYLSIFFLQQIASGVCSVYVSFGYRIL